MAIVLSFFAVYGILQLIAKGLFSSRSRCGECPIYVHRVIGVKNCEDAIEGMLRTLVWEDIREDLIVIDLGSTDETGEIIRRMEIEYDFLHIMTLEEYQEYMRGLAKVYVN